MSRSDYSDSDDGQLDTSTTLSGGYHHDNRRAEHLRHIVQSEEAYIEALTNISVVYKPVCEKIYPVELKDVFFSIQTFLAINSGHLQAMHASLNVEPDTLGAAFKKLVPQLRLYSSYASYYESARAQIATFRAKNSAFNAALDEAQADPRCKNASLESLLITPIQRIPRYSLLLRDLIKYTDKNYPGYDVLVQACKEVDEVTAYLNTYVKDSADKLKLSFIIEAVRGIPPPSKFFIPSRAYIAEIGPIGRPLVVSGRKNLTMKSRNMFLLTDSLVICSTTSDFNPEKPGSIYYTNNQPNLTIHGEGLSFKYLVLIDRARVATAKQYLAEMQFGKMLDSEIAALLDLPVDGVSAALTSIRAGREPDAAAGETDPTTKLLAPELGQILSHSIILTSADLTNVPENLRGFKDEMASPVSMILSFGTTAFRDQVLKELTSQIEGVLSNQSSVRRDMLNTVRHFPPDIPAQCFTICTSCMRTVNEVPELFRCTQCGASVCNDCTVRKNKTITCATCSPHESNMVFETSPLPGVLQTVLGAAPAWTEAQRRGWGARARTLTHPEKCTLTSKGFMVNGGRDTPYRAAFLALYDKPTLLRDAVSQAAAEETHMPSFDEAEAAAAAAAAVAAATPAPGSSACPSRLPSPGPSEHHSSPLSTMTSTFTPPPLPDLSGNPFAAGLAAPRRRVPRLSVCLGDEQSGGGDGSGTPLGAGMQGPGARRMSMSYTEFRRPSVESPPSSLLTMKRGRRGTLVSSTGTLRSPLAATTTAN